MIDGLDYNNQPIEEKQEALTDRELEILCHVLDGKTSAEVAAIVRLSKRTIDFHLSSVYSKLDVKNRVQAIRAAASLGLFNIK